MWMLIFRRQGRNARPLRVVGPFATEQLAVAHREKHWNLDRRIEASLLVSAEEVISTNMDGATPEVYVEPNPEDYGLENTEA